MTKHMGANIYGQDKAAGNIRFGNRLADGIAIGYKSISAIVSPDEYNFTFNCYLHL